MLKSANLILPEPWQQFGTKEGGVFLCDTVHATHTKILNACVDIGMTTVAGLNFHFNMFTRLSLFGSQSDKFCGAMLESYHPCDHAFMPLAYICHKANQQLIAEDELPAMLKALALSLVPGHTVEKIVTFFTEADEDSAGVFRMEAYDGGTLTITPPSMAACGIGLN